MIYPVYSSIGNFPPVGVLDGSFTDPGSYQGCINLRTKLSDYPTNKGYTNYCVVAFRPIIESRPRFHMIFQQLQGLRDVFPNRHLLCELSNKAQYFNYVYLKTGVCIPAECTANDVQQVTKLVSERLSLMSGPVKCFTKTPTKVADESVVKFGQIENNWVQVSLDSPLNSKQSMAAALVATFFFIVLFATIWHAIELGSTKTSSSAHQPAKMLNRESAIVDPNVEAELTQVRDLGLKHIAFNYFSAISNCRDFVDTSTKPFEITCLHGLRVCTMVWIILVHTLQYNEWSGFTRIFENVRVLQNPLLHPFYNANYVVDNFFLMSGLLAAYTTWYANKGDRYKFSFLSSIVGRYLRLTPQVLLVSLLYILLPLASEGPFWYDMTRDASKYCEKNWWVNLLHIQAYFREDEICNLVSWWISVDMTFYLLALVIIYIALNGDATRSLCSTLMLVLSFTAAAAYKHYIGQYTPNNLGTVPQIGEVWTRYIVNFFWSPLPHAYPFFLGLWVGYSLADNKLKPFIQSWSNIGTALACSCLILVNISSHIWMSGMLELGDQYLMTTYNVLCTYIWATALAWIIMACHYGCLPLLNSILSIKPFVIISKASFIIYLSHMLVVRLYFGSNNTVIEVSTLNLTYIVTGNIFLSIILGIFLCITFEGPCMKFQRVIVRLVNKMQTDSKLVTTDPKEKIEFSSSMNKSENPSQRVLFK